MKFDTHFPSEQLKPYITRYVISENDFESEYTVFPSVGLVGGFQYKGELATVSDSGESPLASAGITGISDHFRVFRNSAGIGTILVYFTSIGFTHFAKQPANELFNQSLSLTELFDNQCVNEVEEQLDSAITDKRRIKIVDQFFLSQLRDIQIDELIVEAIRLIHQSKGTIRIKELNDKLFISQSPFEKRFRKVVGTTPKKFTSIVRFNTVLHSVNLTKSLTEISYDNGFFDQAHFIKNFKQFTGQTPENFKRLL